MSRMRLLAMTALLATLSPVRADLQFSPKHVKLGDVYTGRPLKQTFSFTNRGPGVVRILRLNAECGCMTPQLKKKVYQPGESGKFELDVNTLTQPPGPHDWHVHVTYSIDGKEKMRELHLHAKLHSEITVEPAKLSLSTTGPLSHEIIITDKRSLPLQVVNTATGTPHVAASFMVEGNKQRIKLDVKETLPVGAHEGIVSIVTNDPAYRELRVPISIIKRERSGISAAPSNVNLTMSKGQPGSRIVLLRATKEEEVIVEKIETDNPALACRWAAGPGKMATLKVSVDGAKVTDVLRGTVRVHVRQPAKAMIEIPVNCIVR